MAFAQKAPHILPLAKERRRHQRVRVNLLGRYMLQDRREFPCQVSNMSPGGMALIAPIVGSVGERVIAYVDHIGRLEGVITRRLENGFAMSIAATARKRDKLAAQLTWLANRQTLGLPEDRRHERITPSHTATRMLLPNDLSLPCRIIDMSLSGVAISCEQHPPVNALVTIGTVPGRVVRHLESGFAVELTRLQHPDFLEESLTTW